MMSEIPFEHSGVLKQAAFQTPIILFEHSCQMNKLKKSFSSIDLQMKIM